MIEEKVLMNLIPQLINVYGLNAIFMIVGVILLAKLINILIDALARKLKGDPIKDMAKNVDKLVSDLRAKDTVLNTTLDLITEKIKSSLDNSQAEIVTDMAFNAMTYIMLRKIIDHYRLIEDGTMTVDYAIETLKRVIDEELRNFNNDFTKLPDVDQSIVDINTQINILKNKKIFDNEKFTFYEKIEELYKSKQPLHPFITHSISCLKTIMVELKLR